MKQSFRTEFQAVGNKTVDGFIVITYFYSIKVEKHLDRQLKLDVHLIEAFIATDTGIVLYKRIEDTSYNHGKAYLSNAINVKQKFIQLKTEFWNHLNYLANQSINNEIPEWMISAGFVKVKDYQTSPAFE